MFVGTVNMVYVNNIGAPKMPNNFFAIVIAILDFSLLGLVKLSLLFFFDSFWAAI